GLVNVPPDDAELERALRLNLAAWGRELAPLQALVHHEGRTEFQAFSLDGRLLLTGSSDRTARVWDTATGLPVGALSHPGPVFAGVFSPDGRSVLTAAYHEMPGKAPGAPVVHTTLRAWDTATGNSIGPSFEHNGSYLGLALGPEGKTALSVT